MYLRISVSVFAAHEKLQEAERLADKSDIAQLKTQIVNLEAKLERERIEAEKLLSVEKHEKEVNLMYKHDVFSLIMSQNVQKLVRYFFIEFSIDIC